MSREQIEEIAREMCHLSAECKTCQICNERYYCDDDFCYFQCVAKEIINHGYRKQSEGEWVQQPIPYEDEIVCSVCGANFNILDNCTEKFDFCPHCGAKMKGGEQE